MKKLAKEKDGVAVILQSAHHLLQLDYPRRLHT